MLLKINGYLQKSKNASRKTKGMHGHPKPMGCSKSSSKREVYSSIILHHGSRKISDNLTLHLKILEKEWKKPGVTIKKEIINIREEINEIEMRKTMEKIDENKNRLFENIIKLIKLYLGSSSKWKWAYYTERSKSERKTPIQYINAYIWNLER